MKPPNFEYYQPNTIAEAVSLLSRNGGDAKIMAGGQSLLPMLNMRLARPQVIVDISRIPEFHELREQAGELVIGATVRHAQVERSSLVAKLQPLLHEAITHVGHPQIRNRGTVCGSLAHADPAAELPAVWSCLDGRFRLCGPNGEREVGAEEFFLGYFMTSMQPGELLVEARLPVLAPRIGYSFVEFSRRSGDFALVGVACTVGRTPEGALTGARVALTGVGAGPVRAKVGERYLEGMAPETHILAEAARLIAGEIDPESDIHASADYRRHLAGVLAGRALTRAVERAAGGEPT